MAFTPNPLATLDNSPDAEFNGGGELVKLVGDLSVTGNAGEVIAVNGTETGLELVPLNVAAISGLQSSLDGKIDKNAAIVGAQKTKITYDAKGIVTGGADLVAADIPPLDASKINSGVFDLARIPAGAIPTLSVVANQAARFALTTASVQNGDTVKQTDTNVMYYVVNDASLNTEAGYQIYSAQTDWSLLTSKPATITSLATLGTAVDKLAYTTGIGAWAEASLTPFARTILDDASQADARTTLGVGVGDSPTLTGITLSGLTASRAVVTDGANALASLAYTPVNTSSTLVQRDASGNFAAGIITANLNGNASSVTTNANLTGVITSSGNATSIASQTGTGTKFVVDTGPTILNPVINNIAASADFTLTQNAVAAVNSQSTGAVANTLSLRTGFVGVGTATPNNPLQFANIVQNRKISLWETVNNEHQFYGFGVNANTLRYQVDAAASSHVFYSGATAASSVELLRISGGSGNVLAAGTIQSSNPRFLATASTSASNVTGGGQTHTVVFNNEITDVGAGYNPATGIFTAPVTGTYMFSAGVLVSGIVSHTRYDLLLVTTARTYSLSLHNCLNTQTGGFDHSGTCAISVPMTAGDTARVNIVVSGGTQVVSVFGDAANWTTFSGHLVV